MLSLPSRTKMFLFMNLVDMRKSFDGLFGIVREEFQQDPLSGHLFLFVNKRRDRMKAIFWDDDGFVIWYKKPEAHYPHFFLFTESGDDADNFACRPASAG